MSRQSICFPRWGAQDVTGPNDAGFEQELQRWYVAEEAAVLEGLVNLKARLRTLPTEDFWTEAVEGIAHIMGAEIAFIMKRMLVDDQDSAVEMPPLGQPGSCLMAAALHVCDTSNGGEHTYKENKFHAYACPCAYMRHDKIFVIPENLDSFITNNPNQVPVPVEAYMAVPLFAEDKCVAHFGVMWSKESSPNKRLSWAFVEMLLHSLEDMVGQRILEGSNFVKPSKAPLEPPETPQLRVIPHHAISVAQSLRPYAGSLSHELRTPMQGVVGMLDVMYATVQDAVQSAEDHHLKKVFQNLMESIEVVQDSSRRAVVAADNVVHAYDMNMSVPDSAQVVDDDQDVEGHSPRTANFGHDHDKQPDIVIEGHDLPASRPQNKRRRDSDPEFSPRSKALKIDCPNSPKAQSIAPSQQIKDGLFEAENVHFDDKDVKQATRNHARLRTDSLGSRASPVVTSAHGHHNHHHHHHHVHRTANVRAVLQYVISEGLKTGGRPDYMTVTPIDRGEIIEVRSRSSNNTIRQKIIKWTVDDHLPETLDYDEKDFSKLISCLVLNAIKFTEGVDGRVDVHARYSTSGKHTTITITDNGPGMPAEFLPRLFKPFSQNNGSITRQSDGLGLGLMVAKGIARKLGGDLTCLKAETKAPDNGCQFEIKLPLTAGETISRPASPTTSPTVQRRGDDTFELPDSLPPLNGHTEPPRSHTEAGNSLPASPDSKLGLVRSLSAINDMAKAQHGPKPKSKSRSAAEFQIDRALSQRYPLTILVAEDNKINRKLLVSMLSKLGYTDIFEAHDGVEAVRQVSQQVAKNGKVDVVLMDLWMPLMDGYEATERILQMEWTGVRTGPTVLAVTADATNDALDRAAQVGMEGFMTKPYKLVDLQRLIIEYCSRRHSPVGVAIS